MGIVVTTPAATYPVTRTEAKTFARIDGTAEDALTDSLIAAATDYVEQYLGRSLMEQTLRLDLDTFSDVIELRRGPVRSVSWLKYYDTAGVQQTVSSSDYTVDLSSDPQWLVRNTDAAWPSILDAANAVSVAYVCGYTTLPLAIKHAVLLLISQWYDLRTPVVDRAGMAELLHAVTALLTNYRSFAA